MQQRVRVHAGCGVQEDGILCVLGIATASTFNSLCLLRFSAQQVATRINFASFFLIN